MKKVNVTKLSDMHNYYLANIAKCSTSLIFVLLTTIRFFKLVTAAAVAASLRLLEYMSSGHSAVHILDSN